MNFWTEYIHKKTFLGELWMRVASYQVYGSLAVLLFAGQAVAYQVPGNPDEVPSIGLTVGNGHLTGDASENNLPGTFLYQHLTGDADSSLYSIGGDVRLPINNVLTLNFGVNHIEQESNWNRKSNGQTIYENKIRTSGYHYTFGVRLYLR